MRRTVDPAASLRALNDVGDLDRAIANSHDRPVLIYKHSVTCGRSGQALEEIEAWIDAGSPADAEVHIVDVHSGRGVARTIAERLGVRHESPQILLVRDGVVRWHASHGRVTAEAIQAALADAIE